MAYSVTHSHTFLHAVVARSALLPRPAQYFDLVTDVVTMVASKVTVRHQTKLRVVARKVEFFEVAHFVNCNSCYTFVRPGRPPLYDEGILTVEMLRKCWIILKYSILKFAVLR